MIKRLRRPGLSEALITRDGRYLLDPWLSVRTLDVAAPCDHDTSSAQRGGASGPA